MEEHAFKQRTISRQPQPGELVEFLVEQKRKGGIEPFMARGRIVEIYTSTFGGVRRKSAAKIRTQGKYLKIYPGRKHTTISVDKLVLMK